jgi:hypothetical protein
MPAPLDIEQHVRVVGLFFTGLTMVWWQARRPSSDMVILDYQCSALDSSFHLELPLIHALLDYETMYDLMNASATGALIAFP